MSSFTLLLTGIAILLSGICYSQTNIALGKTYSASQSWNSSKLPENAFDENYSTEWVAGAGPTQWVAVDLEGQYDVETIKLTLSQVPDGFTTHNIYKTTDNINWTLFETLSGNTVNNQVVTLDYSSSPIQTNGLRFETTISPSWVAWYEIEIFETSLPVELVQFHARHIDDFIKLSWQTASETNNSGFYLQRSSDGRNWQDLTFVPGSGTTQEEQSYIYTDERPLSGTNYYRLQQMDHDGKFEYSDIRSVMMEGNNNGVQVYPNPLRANGLLNINLPTEQEGSTTLRIFDTNGKMLHRGNLVTQYNQTSYGHLPTGVYFIEVKSGYEVWRERLVIVK